MTAEATDHQGTLPAVLLGISAFCFYIGYFAHGLIVETIISKMHDSIDSSIDQHAGYTGQSIQFVVFAFGCFIAPTVVDVLGSKKSLMLCSALFSLFFAGFLHFNLYYFYISHAMMGFAYGLFNGAEGAYIAEHSTERSVGWTLSLETTISHLGLIGAGVALFIGRFVLPNLGAAEYSETHIKILYSIYLCFGIISFIINSLLPNKTHPESLANKNANQKNSLSTRILGVLKVARNPLAWIFAPVMIHQGIFTAFYLTVYPSFFGFDARLTDKAGWMVVVMCFAAGSGIIVGGALISAGCRKYKNFGLTPSMILHTVCLIVSSVLVELMCPSESFIKHTNEETPITPGYVTVATVAVLVGIVDGTITTSRGCICQRMLPDLRDEMYSFTRLIQAFSTAGMLALSSHMLKETWLLIQAVSTTVALGTFVICIILWKKRESKISVQMTEKPTRINPPKI